MALKTSPEFRLHIWDRTEIPHAVVTPFSFSDVIYAQIIQDGGDNSPGDIPEGNPFTTSESTSDETQKIPNENAKPWTQQKRIPVPGKMLRIVTFKDGLAKEGIAAAQGGLTGIALIPGHTWVHSYIPDTSVDPRSKDRKTVAWRGIKGSAWDTTGAAKNDVTGIYHSARLLDEEMVVETVESLEAGQQFKLKFTPLGLFSKGPNAYIRVEFGGTTSVVFRDGSFPALERRSKDNKGWENWRNLNDVGNLPLDKEFTFSAEHISGRLYLTVGDKSFDIVNKKVDDVTKEAENKPVFTEAFKLRISVANISVSVKLCLLSYDYANTLLRNAFQHLTDAREYLHNQEVREYIGLIRVLKRDGYGVLPTEGIIYATGWRGNGTQIIVGYLNDIPNGEGTQVIKYGVILKPSADGHETPFLTGVHGYFEGSYLTSVVDPLAELSDALTAAYISHTESSAQPGTTSVSEIKVQISRSILDSLAPFWNDTLREDHYNPVAFSVRHCYDNGDYSPWVTRLKGYIWQVGKTTDKFGADAMELVLRDPMIRLMSPAGNIDPILYPAPSYLHVEKKGMPVYPGDIVQSILRIAVGPDEAQRMNGNGDPNRFSAQSEQIPVIAKDKDKAGIYHDDVMPTENAPVMPQYFQYANSWIESLAADPSGLKKSKVFFYGYVDENNRVNAVNDNIDNWPVPIYGDLGPILENCVQWIIPDAIYKDDDPNMVVERIETRSDPANDFNTWIVADTPPDGKAGAGGAMYIGRAQLESGHRRAPETSWPRTSVTQLKAALTNPSIVQEMADNMAKDSPEDAEYTEVFTFRGEESMQWGDLIYIKQLKFPSPDSADESDFSLPLRHWFRIVKLEMAGSRASGTYMATATCKIVGNNAYGDLGLIDPIFESD